MLQLLMALKYSHDSSLLHRDLKAENVFLNKSMEVKLGDFGTAQFNQMMHSQIGTSTSKISQNSRILKSKSMTHIFCF